MAYSDFTLKRVKAELDLQWIETESLFANIKALKISDYLEQTLKRNLWLALAINTEKARSELLIINILLEVKEKLNNQISLFSGVDFNVDKERGLAGFCDFILSQSSEQLYLEAPAVTIVEAKNESIFSGMGQCLAEMYAAKIYNEKEGFNLPCIYGAVTTGDEWKFLKLGNDVAYIDADLYHISQIGKIVGILAAMLQQSAELK